MSAPSRGTRALVLAAVFLIGSFGLPTFDALAFHERGTTRPHFEAAGTTCGHSDRCVLGATFPGPRIAAVPRPGVRPALPIRTAEQVVLVTSLRSIDQASPWQPRAPPVSPV